METILKTVRLENKEAGAFKEYNLFLIEKPDGHVVDYTNGRIGNVTGSGTLTKSPVSLESATNMFDKKIKSKMGDGYKANGEASAFSNTNPDKVFTGILPQLLNPIEEHEITQYIESPLWIAQEKKDGKRITMKVSNGESTPINRTGFVCGVPSEITESLKSFPDCVMDGELVGNMLWVWDIQDGYGVLRQERYATRYNALETLFEKEPSNVKLVPTAYTTEEKQALFDRLKNEGKEGIVFKRHDAPYTVGRPNKGGDALKFKFLEDVTVRVVKVNDKSSVLMGILDGDKIVEIGNVTIPPNHQVPQVSDCVDVSYLYAYKGGSLVQPIYRGKRDDHECDQITKLKYKSEED